MNEKDIITLKNSMLFKDMNDKEITEAVNSLSVTKKFYKKDELILMAGSTTNFLGMVLSGSLTIEINDVWGNRTILSYVEKGEFFAEAFAILQDELVSVDVNANEESEIALFNITTEVPSTKAALGALRTITDRKALVVAAHGDELTNLSLRNAPEAHVIWADQLNTHGLYSGHRGWSRKDQW